MSEPEQVYPPATKELAAQRKSLAPKPAEAFKAFSQSVFADGALPAKTKQLIAVAVAHVTQCPYCIRGHTDGALKHGATAEEIMEAIWVAAEMRPAAPMPIRPWRWIRSPAAGMEQARPAMNPQASGMEGFVVMVTQRVALVTGSGKKPSGGTSPTPWPVGVMHIAVHYRTSAKEAAETVEHLRRPRSRGGGVSGRPGRGVGCPRPRPGDAGPLRAAGCPGQLRRRLQGNAAGGSHRGGRAPQFRGQSARDVPLREQAGLAMVRQPEGGCIVNFGDWAQRGRTSTMPPTSSARAPSRP